MSKLLLAQPQSDGFFALGTPPAGSNTPRRFRKEVMYEGRFIHPQTGKTHIFAKSDLDRIAQQSNELAAKQKIPFPDGHDFASLKNMGFWQDFAVQPRASGGGHGLFATVSVPVESHAELVGKTIDSVSVYLEKEVKLSDGSVISGPVCTHVCGTNYPVIRQQSEFEQFSKSQGGDVELLQFGDDDMDKLKTMLIAALGLKADADDKDVGLAIKNALATKTALSAENERLLADLKEAIGLAADRGAVSGEASKTTAAEPLKSKRELELEAKLSALRGQAVTTMLDAALSVGKITKAERDVFLSICSIGTVNVVPFGKTAAEEVDPAKLIETMLSDRKAGDAVKLGSQSNRGESEDVAAKKARVKSQADWFASRGFQVTMNADGLDFTAERKSGKK